MKFEKEISYIKDERVKRLTVEALKNVSPKFFTAGASSTGKYHPDFSAGEGGLYRHVRAAAGIGILAGDILKDTKTQIQRDAIVAALILHDCAKSGIEFECNYTEHTHPMLAFKLLDVSQMDENDAYMWKHINNLIATHMGQWRVSSYSDYTLPAIVTQDQVVVHWCDYIASRKRVNVAEFGIGEMTEKPSSIDKKRCVATIKRIITDPTMAIAIANVVERATKVEAYLEDALFLAGELMKLETTLMDDYKRNVVIGSIVIRACDDGFVDITTVDDPIHVIHINMINGYTQADVKSWIDFAVMFCERIAKSNGIRISHPSEKAQKELATAKQCERMAELINELSVKSECTEVKKYVNLNLEVVSKGQAGIIISELKKAKANFA